MASKSWAGRFRSETDSRVESFTESISIDYRLFRQDVRASIAHVRMLAQCGLIEVRECDQIVQALGQIEAEIGRGDLRSSVEHEDIHMHIEAALTERLGDVGRKLHTARSRNDQVATDLRLWVREALDRVDSKVLDLQRTWLDFAERHRNVLLPGYTHLQRAQPVLAAHYALAYVEKLERDRQRIRDCRRRVNVLPLGSAAIAGTSLPIDREFVARELGFDSVSSNSMDAVSDRDFAIEAVFVLVMIAEHLAGWAEEWVLWTTHEFGFLALPDSVCTGSSIMPQKKNPDVCELIRGKSARLIGDLTALLVLVKGLPLAYNRDLQEDKPPLFDAFDTVEACLELASLVVAGARLNVERITKGLEEGFLDATTLMEWLIKRGVPQRTAHEVVGKLVAICEERRCRLGELREDDLKSGHAALVGADVRAILGVENAIRAFCSAGSTAYGEVSRQLLGWKERCGFSNRPVIAP